MTHTKIVIDSNTHFLIDTATRQIRNTASSKISVMQNDHNSERLTFSIPRFIEGHDMSTSDKVEVHYINVDAETKEQSTGVYVMDDVKVETSGDGDSEVVTCSWLISKNATKYVGSLTFVVRFVCLIDDAIDYAWHTAPFTGISVGETIDCSGSIEGEYLDIIAAWEKEHIEPLDATVEEHQIAIEKLQNQSTIIATASSNTAINDVDIDSSELKGVKEVDFYGYTTQEQGATILSPKKLIHPNEVNLLSCCNHAVSLKGTPAYCEQPLLATNKYSDKGWVDLVNDKIHYKFIIKKIVLDGTEGSTIWKKASSPEGRYFVNLHSIDGLFTNEDLSRIANGISIAYDDCKCTIGNTYYTNTLYEDGQFRIVQGRSSNTGTGYFRFEFFTEVSTLDEVIEAVQKNPITIFIPMIYDVKEVETNCNYVSYMLKRYGKNPFTLYFYDINYSNKYPTEVTYKVDVGLSIQNFKNAIIALGGNI